MPPDDGRIHALEQRVDSLSVQIARLLQREADARKQRHTRLAQTIQPIDGSSSSSTGAYPGYVYEIVALDCSSPGDEGSLGSSSSSSAGFISDAYPAVFFDGITPDTIGRHDVSVLPRFRDEEAEVIHALDPLTSIPIAAAIEVFWHNGRWWVYGGGHPGSLIGVQLAEQHPGRSKLFDVWLGVWNPATHSWGYDRSAVFSAIDHRYDVPYPAKYATGLAQRRPG